MPKACGLRAENQVFTGPHKLCWQVDHFCSSNIRKWKKKQKKKRVSSYFQGKVNFFENLTFNHFYYSHWYFFRWYSSHKFREDLGYEIFLPTLKRKCKKYDVKVEVSKMMTNIFLVLFSNACSILEMHCNRNLTKLVYQTLLCSGCKAWALKLSRYLKKGKHFPLELGYKWH